MPEWRLYVSLAYRLIHLIDKYKDYFLNFKKGGGAGIYMLSQPYTVHKMGGEKELTDLDNQTCASVSDFKKYK